MFLPTVVVVIGNNFEEKSTLLRWPLLNKRKKKMQFSSVVTWTLNTANNNLSIILYFITHMFNIAIQFASFLGDRQTI